MKLGFSSSDHSRNGGVTPLTLLSLALLLAVVGLVVDGGTLMEDRRHVQAVADAAALAAADDLFANYIVNGGTDPSHTAQASAWAVAASNGFTNGDGQTSITVNVSPANYQSGPNAGSALPAGYVEVIVTYNASRLFSGVFGVSSIPVCARAVARGQWAPVGNKVLSLNTTANVGVGVSNFAKANVHGGLLVNSSSHSAISVDSTASLTASLLSLNSGGGGLLGLVGNVLDLLLGLLSPPPAPTVYGPPVADPFRSLPPPDPTQLSLSTQSTSALNISGGAQNLYPGVYQGGINISNGASVTLHPNSDGSPGIYYLQGGGLNVLDTSSLTMVAGDTTGVMIYNDWQSNSDAVNLQGSGGLILAPPSSGTYQGLTIFQKRGTLTSPAPTLTILGGSNTSITGTIYVAYGNVTLEGVGGTSNVGGQIVADTVTANGSGTMNVNPKKKPTANSRTLGLVE